MLRLKIQPINPSWLIFFLIEIFKILTFNIELIENWGS
jgi:hypothetical protein